MMIYTVHIYCSNHGTSDVEHFEMTYKHGYGKGMTTQRKQIPPVPPSTKPR